MVGYAVIMRVDNPNIALKRSRIVDMLVERNDPDTVRQLLEFSLDYTADDGSHMLEVVGFPGEIRKTLQDYSPYQHRKEAWPFLYKTTDPQLGELMAQEGNWYATSVDGDGCFPFANLQPR